MKQKSYADRFRFHRDDHAGVVAFWPLVNIKPNGLSGF